MGMDLELKITDVSKDIAKYTDHNLQLQGLVLSGMFSCISNLQNIIQIAKNELDTRRQIVVSVLCDIIIRNLPNIIYDILLNKYDQFFNNICNLFMHNYKNLGIPKSDNCKVDKLFIESFRIYSKMEMSQLSLFCQTNKRLDDKIHLFKRLISILNDLSANILLAISGLDFSCDFMKNYNCFHCEILEFCSCEQRDSRVIIFLTDNLLAQHELIDELFDLFKKYIDIKNVSLLIDIGLINDFNCCDLSPEVLTSFKNRCSEFLDVKVRSYNDKNEKFAKKCEMFNRYLILGDEDVCKE